MRLSVLAVVLACSFLLPASCGSAPEKPKVLRYASPPNVVLVTIDTLRADHLSCYGYFRETSPNIDALAEQGLLYERAYSASGTTLPSHLSIFTGLYPHQHGHVSNKGAMKGPYVPAPGRRPAADFFGSAGYTTAAFVSGNTVKKTTGVQHGFEVWDQPKTLHREGEATRELVVDWLGENAAKSAGKPFFLWVHFWDVHEPNDPPEPWRSMFHADAQVEALVAARHIDAAVLQAKFSPLELSRLFYPELVDPLLHGEDVSVPPIDHQKVLDLIDAYDGSIRYVDEQVGAICARLKELGLWENTIVALAADHGQALGQHDWLEHGEIQGEEVHVPLILRFPGELTGAPARVERVVSTVDLMPTVIGRIEGDAFREFAAQASGSDLLDPAFARLFAFSQRTERERDWDKGRKFAVTLERFKYYHREEGADELFDLEQDPGELKDVVAEHPEEARKLRELVEHVLATNAANGSTRGTSTEAEREELERELRESGYLGSEGDSDGEH
jgi:arylsulfatase